MSAAPPETLSILRPAAGGESIAHHDGRTVFVTGAIPGETVDAVLTSASSRVLRATVTAVREASPHRIPDRREAMGVPGAGGIEFAHVALAHSRALKEEAAADQLRRIGGIDPAAVDFALHPAPSEAPAGGVADTDPEAGTRWRTRVQSAVHPDGRPGMLEAGSHRVVPVEGDALPLAVPELDALHLTRRRFPGVTRIELAAGTDSGAIVLRGPDAAAAAQDLVPVLEHVPGDWSVLSAAAAPSSSAARRSGGRRSRGRGGRNRGGGAAVPLTLHTGSGFVTESVPGLGRSLRVRGAGFWQVHRDAAALLTNAVRSAVGEPGDGQVLDLYSGAGLLGIALAEDGHRVLGIEGSAEAVEDARANAHGLDARFTAGRVETAALVADARVAVLDPPRAGAGAAVVDALTASAVERIVHVACDGATLARDLRRLADGGFRIDSVVAHDLFPLTGHLEFVAVLSR